MKAHKHKPRIGVTGPDKGGKVLWWFTRLGVWWAGGNPKRFTPSSKADLGSFDGFIISGGGDINPECYGEAAVLKALQYDQARDSLEQEVIQYAVSHKKPVLGICRGMQILNVSLGGTLYQEAKEALENFLPSNSLLSKFIGRREVMIEKNSKLFSILGENNKRYRVNSIHHQAVNKLGNGLSIVAKEENNLIQAIEQVAGEEHPFLIGVQWHPELMLHTAPSRRLFRALIKASKV